MGKRPSNSRWVKSNERYPKDVLQYIYDVFHEADGWRHGARVRKKK